jgi:hypothetical protein
VIFHVQDEAFERAVVTVMENLRGITKLFKEVDALQGAPRFDSQMHSKATTILEAFHVMHMLL